jgi:hypothetical protein
MMDRWWLIFGWLAVLAGSAAAAPVVTYTLSYNDDGTGSDAPGYFAIYAQASADSGGIFAYGVDLMGPPLDFLSNAGVGGRFRRTLSGQKFAGFLIGFSADQVNGRISGLQDLSKLSDLIPIYGFGQVNGDLATRRPPGNYLEFEDINGNGSLYQHRLLLGVGHTTWNVFDVRFERASVDNKVSVFDDCSGVENIIIPLSLVESASSSGALQVSPTDVTPCAAPEPASILPILSASFALIFRTCRSMRG